MPGDFQMRKQYSHDMSAQGWIILGAAALPAVAAIVAAIIAANSARSARRSELHAQKVHDLEERISDRKYEIYKPMINLLGDILGAGPSKKFDEVLSMMRDFATWIGICGSDDAVIAFHNFLQAAYKDAPPAIMLRLYGDFLLAARKDMGYADTNVRREQLLGSGINDIYDHPDVVDPSFEEVCDRLNWSPPWLADLVPLDANLL
jgi:hypothetical protein